MSRSEIRDQVSDALAGEFEERTKLKEVLDSLCEELKAKLSAKPDDASLRFRLARLSLEQIEVCERCGFMQHHKDKEDGKCQICNL